MTKRNVAIAGVIVVVLAILSSRIYAGASPSIAPVETPSVGVPANTTGSQTPALPQVAASLSPQPATLSAPFSARVVDFQYTPDGSLFVVTGQSVGVLDLASKTFKWSHPIDDGCCSAMAISATSVAVITDRGEAVYVWDSASGQSRFGLHDADKHFSTLTFDPTGAVLATGEFAQIRLWDARSGQQRSDWQTGDEGISQFPWTKGVTNLAFTPDGRFLLSANWYTGQVMQWEAASATLVSSFDLTNTVYYKFTPDASRLLADFNQYGFEIHDPRTGAVEAVHAKIIGASPFVVFSADGRRVAVWGYNTAKGSTAAVWELDTDQRLQEFSIGDINRPGWSQAALSPDGRTLALSAVNSPNILFFDIETGKQIDSIRVPPPEG